MVAITFCGALGAVLAGGIAWWLLPRYGWRYFVGACAVPAILVFILQFFLIYESPRFLYISGNIAAEEEMVQYFEIILFSGEITCPPSERRGRILDLFNSTLRKRTFFITLVWFVQAFGYWGVTFHLPEYIGSQGVDPYFNMFTVFIGELPGLCLAMILIENHMLGRVKCLRFFSILTSISLILFGFVNVDFLKAVFVVVCYFFMVPIYSILNTFTPEIYPTDVRSTALAWVNIVIEIPAMISPFIAASMLSSTVSWLYPTVWASCFMLQFLLELGLNLETAGQDLKDTTLKNVDGSTSTTTSL
ncbi:hypothetical protein KUTeg_023755 [Tegillarca granosa]|uniref:Major facilitator superfamily (MFS) profile domain-containing protein n=1 Tax=Tegillarca granosa TaxID=220873 RepID=A0ABQ9E870_TEGGR|nr:hypothetical protein KUTeg_023755 [Tegillarca granosa]